MNLVLFAHYFPYKRSETFLITEFKFAQQHFSYVSIFTLFGDPKNLTVDVNNAKHYDPVLKAGGKAKLLVKGVFNLAPFGFHLKEFFRKKIFLNPKQTYWWAISLLITRNVLSSSSYKELVKDLKHGDPTTLYFYWGDNLCWIIPYVQKQLRKNSQIAIRLHGSDLYESFKADYAPLRTDIFKAVKSIYTVSENGKNYLANRYPAYTEKMHLARLGVFDNGLNPFIDNGEKVVVSVSNLVPLKRVHLIFEALQLMTTDITWHHFGTGPLMTEMLQLVSNARPGLQIKFHGFIKNTEMLNFFKTNPIHALMNVSTSEGVPVSIMEAFSFGIPVIATNVGGTSELVDSTTGILLPKDFAVSELADAINRIVNAEVAAAKEYRDNARAAFLEKASLRNYENFYTELKKPA